MILILRRRRRVILAASLLIGAVLAALLHSQFAPIGELMPAAIAALQSDDIARVKRERWIVFEPVDQTEESGIILYPGGRVSPEAYAPLARALAESGYLTVIVPMPLNLAVFDPFAADNVIAAYPSVQTWVIGGHSLGGVMAAHYAHSRRDLVKGLVLLAAYPEAHIDLSSSDLTVAVIYGDRDGLVTVNEVERALNRLPPDSRSVLIEGANHAQFGWYGAQAGDTQARISRDEQQSRVVEAVRQILQETGR
ncbi:MAG: alpha/beta hydrolase [Chloroflexota bacterium]|nr:alpha/beta hydrolase [Chloroflexota bacterium]MDE2909380.1 alpha/beta hydrolase [Chloroflexota bacterium]